MSKDGRNDKNFSERFKKYMKAEKKTYCLDHNVIIVDDIKHELGDQSVIQTRLKAVRDLEESLHKKRLDENGVEKIWLLVQDLLLPEKPEEIRYMTLHMLSTLSSFHERLGPMRLVFFGYIRENYKVEDVGPLFLFLKGVIGDGRNLEFVEESVAPFLAEYLPIVLKSSYNLEALDILHNLIKFHAAYLDEEVIVDIVRVLITHEMSTTSADAAMKGLKVLGSLLAYSYLPAVILGSFVLLMCHFANSAVYLDEVCKIMKNLMGTYLGNCTLYVLTKILEHHGEQPVLVVRSALYFIAEGLWGEGKISKLDYKPPAIVPVLSKISLHSHKLIILEISFALEKLVRSKSLEMYLSTWDLILETVGNCYKFTETHNVEEEAEFIRDILSRVMDTIENAIDINAFCGNLDKFYDLQDDYSKFMPECSVQKLIHHRIENIYPQQTQWLVSMKTLLHNHFKVEHRQHIRLYTLKQVKNFFIRHRHEFGEIIVKSVILPEFQDIEKDPNLQIRVASVSFLTFICQQLTFDGLSVVLYMIQKVIMAPLCDSKKKEVLNEEDTEDIVEAVRGVIKILKKMIWVIPSSYAFQCYDILLTCLWHHYSDKYISEMGCLQKARVLIFDFIFEMRADEFFHWGFQDKTESLTCSDNNGANFICDNVVGSFTPHIIIDHKNGFHIPDIRRHYKYPVYDELKTSLDDRSDSSSLKSEENHDMKILKSFENTQTNNTVTRLSLTEAARTVAVALNKEKDWNVLRMILEQVPSVLRNKALIVSQQSRDINEFANILCHLLSDKSPVSFQKVPSGFTRSDFQSFLYPVLAALASYNYYLKPDPKRNIILLLTKGMHTRSAPYCASALTLCVFEMREAMMKVLKDVVLEISKISPTVQQAQATLEFLSTLLHFPEVYKNFVCEQYMCVFAIALPYTNPEKFNHYIVSLSYRVIAMWYIKCPLNDRLKFISFITKNLRIALNNAEESRKYRNINDQPLVGQTNEVLAYHEDLHTVLIDLMSRYAFSSVSPKPKRTYVSEWLLADGQRNSWIIGNKIITITTSGCAQRPVFQALCNNCRRSCQPMEKRVENEKDSPNIISRRRHRSELHRTVSHEAKHPLTKDDSQMLLAKDSSENQFGNESSSELFKGSRDNKNILSAETLEEDKEPNFCCCWCQSWAEVYIQQPSGDISYMVRIMNDQSLVSSGVEAHFNDVSAMFSLIPFSYSSDVQCDAFDASCKIEADSHRRFSGNSIPVEPTTDGISSGFNSGVVSSASSEQCLHPTGFTTSPVPCFDSTQQNGVPVQRSHSSPHVNEDDSTVECATDVHKSSSSEMNSSLCKNKCLTEIVSNENVSVNATEDKSLDCRLLKLRRTESSNEPSTNSDMLSSPMQTASVGILGRTRHSSASQPKTVSSEMCSVVSGSSGNIKAISEQGEDDQFPKPLRRGRGYTISDMNPYSRRGRLFLNPKDKVTRGSKVDLGGISPCNVFLQLFFHGNLSMTEDTPLMIPQNNPEITRMFSMLDYIPPQETHKIGVLYMGKGQKTEKEMFSNQQGSYRYEIFKKGLGQAHELKNIDKSIVLHGLQTNGADGDYVYVWQDTIMQVVFHIATMMPSDQNDPNFNKKKCHIGNDYVNIVYNDSEKPYEIETIKSSFNHAIIEITPLDQGTNDVSLLCKPHLVEFVGSKMDVRLVSDTNLPTLVRQLAVHANLASGIWEALTRKELHPNNWIERLRKIRKLSERLQVEIKSSCNNRDFLHLVLDKSE